MDPRPISRKSVAPSRVYEASNIPEITIEHGRQLLDKRNYKNIVNHQHYSESIALQQPGVQTGIPKLSETTSNGDEPK